MTYSRSTISENYQSTSRGLLKSASTVVLLALSACSNAQQAKPPLVQSLQVPRPSGNVALPKPAPVTVGKIPKWRVITPKTLPEGDDWVYYGLTPKDYEAMAKALADALRYAKETQYQLCIYRKEDNCNSHLRK